MMDWGNRFNEEKAFAIFFIDTFCLLSLLINDISAQSASAKGGFQSCRVLFNKFRNIVAFYADVNVLLDMRLAHSVLRLYLFIIERNLSH